VCTVSLAKGLDPILIVSLMSAPCYFQLSHDVDGELSSDVVGESQM
jgi:hypothetical protein